MELVVSCVLNLYRCFRVDIPYSPALYRYLRESGEIKQAQGTERERIIKISKGNLTECKRIQLEEYFEKKLKEIENEA